jgi:hypothetical protein
MCAYGVVHPIDAVIYTGDASHVVLPYGLQRVKRFTARLMDRLLGFAYLRRDDGLKSITGPCRAATRARSDSQGHRRRRVRDPAAAARRGAVVRGLVRVAVSGATPICARSPLAIPKGYADGGAHVVAILNVGCASYPVARHHGRRCTPAPRHRVLVQ